jgi:hypothetical protein
VDANGAFLASSVDLKKTPLAVLEVEIVRLETIVAIDATRRTHSPNKRIADETAALESLNRSWRTARAHAGARRDRD